MERGHSDSGGASRYFFQVRPDAPFRYCAKPTRSERDAGCKALSDATRNRVNPGGLENDPRWAPVTAKNTHPTVKPVDLMAYLVRLITPPGGLCLDPFTGSGSTGCGALRGGFRFLGMERDPEYVPIARARLAAAGAQPVLALEAGR
jgi:site-specific DNA-methyltransferase (adenine-specific)